jgi:hypothetical protein
MLWEDVRVRLLSAGFFVLVAAASPSCKSSPSNGILPDADFQPTDGVDAQFDRNTILDDASFTDVEGLETIAIQKFLHKTPYDSTSFLETYQSNGLQAADAIARAARTYRINPLVFLVYAEITQGLVGAQEYPFPPNRVEYVFQCGCLTSDNCLPELAGLDRQLDCLGRQLRKSLTDLTANGTTVGGWGKDNTSVTLDGQKVTPANDATAALYDRTPVVAEGGGNGMWLFWNVWQKYAAGIQYAGPVGGGAASGWIGDPCSADEQCAFDKAQCALNGYPGGLCTAQCAGDCPTQPDKPVAVCVDFPSDNTGFCFEKCNPGAPACRDGYTCQSVRTYKGAGSDHVCFTSQKP